MSTRWLRVIRHVVVGVVVVLISGVVALFLAYEFLLPSQYKSLATAVSWQGSQHDGSHRTTVRLGPTTLAIPDNYFFTPPRQDAVPKGLPAHADRVTFSLLVSIDGFKPKSKENMADFPDPGLGKKLNVDVHYNEVDSAIWKERNASVDQYRIAKGDLKFRQEIGMYYYTSLYEGEVLFEGPRDDLRGRMVCGGPDPDEYPSDKRELGCVKQVDAGNNLSLTWFYNRNYLPKRTEVDKLVIDGLNQFKTSGPDLRVVE